MRSFAIAVSQLIWLVVAIAVGSLPSSGLVTLLRRASSFPADRLAAKLELGKTCSQAGSSGSKSKAELGSESSGVDSFVTRLTRYQAPAW
jgi:hypothetical protein